MAQKRTVAVDARHMVSGIGTYLRNLLPEMIAQSDWGWRLIGPPELKGLAETWPGRVSWIHCQDPIYTVGEHLKVAKLAKGADLLWVPQYNAPLLWRGALVVTLHDLIHRMPAYTPPGLKQKIGGWLMGSALRRATRVITVSAYSKQKIREYFPYAADKTVVIHNGVQSPPALGGTPPLDVPYVLSFGNALPHKNFPRLIEAFMKVKSEVPEHLVIAGPAGRDLPRMEELARSSGGRIHLMGLQKGPEWARLVRNARLYVCPSLEEGFGLPPLEALSVGVPVACSRSASLPEILGDAAIWFDPRSVPEMAMAIVTGLTDATVRAKVVDVGRTRLSLFTWQASAQRHLEVFREVLQSS
ncbi:MAG: glycosyltransferase family 4 protein [Planctomycetota bacterium]